MEPPSHWSNEVDFKLLYCHNRLSIIVYLYKRCCWVNQYMKREMIKKINILTPLKIIFELTQGGVKENQLLTISGPCNGCLRIHAGIFIVPKASWSRTKRLPFTCHLNRQIQSRKIKIWFLIYKRNQLKLHFFQHFSFMVNSIEAINQLLVDIFLIHI